MEMNTKNKTANKKHISDNIKWWIMRSWATCILVLESSRGPPFFIAFLGPPELSETAYLHPGSNVPSTDNIAATLKA
ncbi:hypothetical protein LXL04_020453 [Taraxacum kok-saghyz]